MLHEWINGHVAVYYPPGDCVFLYVIEEQQPVDDEIKPGELLYTFLRLEERIDLHLRWVLFRLQELLKVAVVVMKMRQNIGISAARLLAFGAAVAFVVPWFGLYLHEEHATRARLDRISMRLSWHCRKESLGGWKLWVS